VIPSLAPIVLFVFNRPDHTRVTLDKLRGNTLAKHSQLIVYSDGPRSDQDLNKVTQVREILDQAQGFGQVTLIYRPHNWGLTANIIEGVSDVIATYGRAIVVEDDVVTSPYFLDYMNQGLTAYESTESIFSISGYSPPIQIPTDYSLPVYWSPRSSSWGWATWADRWNQVDWSLSDYKLTPLSTAQRHAYNRGGNDLTDLLDHQASGRLNSWDIVWCYAHFKHKAGCVYPVQSKVINSGTDGSGTHHTTVSDRHGNTMDETPPRPFPEYLKPHPEILDRFKAFNDVSLWVRYKRIIFTLLRQLGLR
jgi:hypothetical protein